MTFIDGLFIGLFVAFLVYMRGNHKAFKIECRYLDKEMDRLKAEYADAKAQDAAEGNRAPWDELK